MATVKTDNNQRKSRPKDKRDKILQAALKIFAQKGFYKAKVTEIAQEASVADGTIYLYFNNKHDLLISLFEEIMNNIIKRMTEAIRQEPDPLKRIGVFALTHLQLIDENKDLGVIIQVEIRQSSKFMKEYKNERFAQYLNLIARIIEDGQESGVIRREVIPGVAKRAFFGALDEMSRVLVLSPHKKYEVFSAAEQISRIFISGLAIDPKAQP
ncbi:MAG: TetR/AcrR family transcriptional regulator [Deltaproteobacteria bacterium]|nr:TetR/AcrR family transcriptional regulator [Deltaproteobacteria bacterium]MBF0525029.1 TetR/AcrR family transcriptional regulator [Deltaproteobacteria bacterium]